MFSRFPMFYPDQYSSPIYSYTTFHCMSDLIVFIHLSGARRLGCFYLLAVMNSSAINWLCINMFSFLSNLSPCSRIAGPHGNDIRRTAWLFPKQQDHFISPSVWWEGSDLSTSSTSLGPSCSGHSNGCELLSPMVLICILLVTKF